MNSNKSHVLQIFDDLNSVNGPVHPVATLRNGVHYFDRPGLLSQHFELVATALGLDGFVSADHKGHYFCTKKKPYIFRWDLDDGDAFRLAFKLGITLRHDEKSECSIASNFDMAIQVAVYWSKDEECNITDDAALQAAREAIFLAAAAIGRAMP